MPYYRRTSITVRFLNSSMRPSHASSGRQTDASSGAQRIFTVFPENPFVHNEKLVCILEKLMSNLTLTVSIMNVSPGHQVVQKSIVSKCVQLLTCLLTILTYCHSGFVHFPFRVMSCLSTGASDSKVNVISLTIRGNIYGICLCFIAFIIR